VGNQIIKFTHGGFSQVDALLYARLMGEQLALLFNAKPSSTVPVSLKNTKTQKQFIL